MQTLSEQFTFRPATLDDVKPVVDLLNACAVAQTGKPQVDVGEIRTDWRQPTFNLETDTLVVFASDGKLVGYAALWDSAPHVRIFVAGDVHPEYKGRGIGTSLCRWAEERGRQAVLESPAGARVVLVQERLSTHEAARSLLCEQGCRPARHSLRMVIEMDGPPLEPIAPDGIIIRPFRRGEEERAVIQAVREAFTDHWGYVERPFEEEYKEWTYFLNNDPNSDPSLWFVAADGDEIAATSLCHPTLVEDPEMGWVFGLSVRRSWRRRGIALALLHHSFGEFYRRGKRKVGLGVDAQSLTGATRLYKKAGMHVERQYVIYEKELRPGRDLSTQSVEN
ncbi:MAG: hypothetical protein DRJ03_26560 [Chloroflexi bacterium]|nr:MAG: hypothetical protein DRI81_15475 [Chloroflexota bacterium]RLC77619.1 MAG: hypothetical protein DRJ03_26560 [Chloroflexota bacterium]